MHGSGKTTFALRYLKNVNCACRFIFDDMGQAAERLKSRHASTAAELEDALASRWVIFNPHRMFPGEVDKAFLYFCDWAYKASCRGPGKKVFFADEIWRWVSPHVMPKELAMICQVGRAENIELMTATQLPHKLHSSITGQCTELVTFLLDEELAEEKVISLGRSVLSKDKINSLPLGKFLALNRLTRATLSGSVF